MAYKPIILKSAQVEYRDIVAYLSRSLGSPQAASNFINEFGKQVERACQNPAQFPLSRIPELALKGYRSALVNSYIMLFKVDEAMIVIAHIFHQSQEYASLI